VTPQYYAYSYKRSGSTFTGTAQGDLDGDGTASRFEIMGHETSGVVMIAPTISETDPSE